MPEPVGDIVVDPQPDPDPTPDPAPDPQPDPTFTRAQMDAMAARIRKEMQGSSQELAELRDKATRLDELEASSQTELEKAQTRAEQAERDAAKVRETADRRLVEASVLAEATRQNAMKPEHIHRLIDTEAVTVGDDGQVAGAEEAVKAFLDANPDYVGSGRTSGTADQGAREYGKKQLTREQLQKMTSAEIVAAQNEGRLDQVLGVST